MNTNLDVVNTQFPKKSGHLIGTIGNQHAEKIVAVFQPMRNARPQCINILQDRSKLYPINIPIDHRVEIFRSEKVGYLPGGGFIVPRKGQIRQFFSSDLFGMAARGAGQASTTRPRR